MTVEVLKRFPLQDPLLSKGLYYTKHGWPMEIPDALRPYWNRRLELSLEGDCVMWGVRVVVPRKLQEQVLQELHQTHSGISRTKAIARSYVWWPQIDYQVEKMIKSCTRCQMARNAPAVAPLHPWIWPARPWQ